MKGRTRREFLGALSSVGVSLPVFGAIGSSARSRERPNIVLILTDDQGYGDLGCEGNDQIKTPSFDRFHAESVRFTNFYVTPLCSPTRACLMTGRYNYRTGVVDTWVGLAMMRPSEVTIASILSEAGFRTGIFGKWHLGDNYPLRAMDRGFQEALVHNDGIIGSISDPVDNGYTDPVLQHNGQPEEYRGYCTDIFFEAAMQFIEKNRDQPFFVYLPVNVVHVPLEVPEEYVAPYKALGLNDQTARVYGMVANLDENLGRLLGKLRELNLENDTVVIFLSDNGPTGPARYNAGLRGEKGSVYEGGIKSPFHIRWPGQLRGGRSVDCIAAHIDLLPTILDICGLPQPSDRELDGVSLFPLMIGEAVDWPDRTLFFQQSRPDPMGIDEPRLFTNCAVRSQRYKIVMVAPGRDIYTQAVDVEKTQLYDLAKDPGEKHDVAHEHPDIVLGLRREYADWFRDVTRGIDPPVRNRLGAPEANLVVLTSQDLRGPGAPKAPRNWALVHAMAEAEPDGLGFWEVEVARSGRYEITLSFGPRQAKGIPVLKLGRAYLKLGEVAVNKPIPEGAMSVTFNVDLKAGPGRLEAHLTRQRKDGQRVSPSFVQVKAEGR